MRLHRIRLFLMATLATCPFANTLADISGIYKNQSGDHWLSVQQVGSDVFILGEMRRNYWRCKRTATTPGTATERARTGCVEGEASRVRPSTFVFKGTRRGETVTGNYYFVPQGNERGSGVAVFVYAQDRPGVRRISITRGSLAPAAPYYQLNIGDPSSTNSALSRTEKRFRYERKWMFAPIQERDFALSLSSEDLTDFWASDEGMNVYLAQYGDKVAWLAEHMGADGVYVGIGERQGNQIDIAWSSVPRGVRSEHGVVQYTLDGNAYLRRVSGETPIGDHLERRGGRRNVLLTDLYNYPGNIGRAERVWAPGGDRVMTPTEAGGGDRDFDGNGPRIEMTVELKPVRDKIFADISFIARETGGNGTRTSARWSYPVYTAPTGRTIERIVSDTTQRVTFTSAAGGHGLDNWSPSEASFSESFTGNSVLLSYHIIGDTRGDDVSTDGDPQDNTHIRNLIFRPATIELSPLPASVASSRRGDRVATMQAPVTIATERSSTMPSEPLTPTQPLERPASACRDAVQGKIAWDYSGSTLWGDSNLGQLCGATPTSTEPARCFQATMHGIDGNGGVDWGGGTEWQWQNAVALCAGSPDAGQTLACFRRMLGHGMGWRDAIERCN